MRWVKRSLVVASLLLIATVGMCLHHYLPRHEVVHVTGVEVKRMDADGVISAENPADGPTRDVYFINTENPTTREVTVYRNEDTGWGFPWYFKFDSADVQARAQGYSRDPEQLALIRYYGWRFQILSMFPNITDIKAVNSLDEPFPLFNTLFFSILLILLVSVALLVRRALGRRNRPMVADTPAPRG
ncbi:DUF1523 family protein [Pseudomonas xanthosomatis]|uniref:DUF1523 family protein n=1 Tax=Pseudomonas xanthosomatis TaxID=2842356 RepID=UPI003516C828